MEKILESAGEKVHNFVLENRVCSKKIQKAFYVIDFIGMVEIQNVIVKSIEDLIKNLWDNFKVLKVVVVQKNREVCKSNFIPNIGNIFQTLNTV